jgi:molybdopterin converting factor small subunit
MDSDIPEVKVTIPPTLRRLCSGNGASRKGVLSVKARSVRLLLEDLARQHPEVHVRVCDERGEPRQHINVFVNDDHVRVRDGLDTLLNAGDQVTILPAVSGG